MNNNFMLDHKQFCTAFRFSPSPTFVSSLSEGRYIDVNESGLHILGYSREELIGNTGHELSIWNDPERLDLLLAKLLKCNRFKNEPIQLRTKYGEIIDVLWSCMVITFRDEKAMLSFLVDISDRKKMDSLLRYSEHQLSKIIDFIPDATFSIDIQGRVIAWNEAVETMTGVHRKEILGKSNYEHALPFYNKRRPILIDFVRNPNKKYEGKYDVFTRNIENIIIAESWTCLNGNDVYLWGKASPLYDTQGTVIGVIETIRDITDRKNLELAIGEKDIDLEAKARELEDVNTALRVLLKQRENDRKELEGNVLASVKSLVLPNIERLKSKLKSDKDHHYICALESSLNEVVSPFARTLSTRYSSLTNREIQIANLIREEKSTKEIANFLNISQTAVNMYRYRVRQKLGISRRENLRAFLSNLS